jgi:high-affinity iron transporter
LVRIDQRQFLSRIWAGVAAAIGLSVVAVLALSDEAAEAFAGFMSLLAVALITWMILWMATHARTLKAHLHGEVDNALARSSWALVLVAFFAVGREGLETALFLWTGMRSTGGGALIVIAAGVLRYGVHELQEVGLLPGKDQYVLDVSGVINPDGVVASLLRTVFNVVPTMTALELLAWGGYLVIVLATFLVVIRRPTAPSAPQAPAQPRTEVPVS